jgi:Raf kinase inhibitor-like YbhB/YbcL family protein
MRAIQYLTALAAVIAMGADAMIAQDKGKGGGKGKGFTLPPPINLTITGFADGSMIPAKHTCASGQQQGNPSPAMSWSGAPNGTQSFALILHDPDPVLQNSATNDVLHWAIFDIPGDAKGLPEGVPNMAELADGAKQPNNIGGSAGYFGPCPPAGNGKHHYTFELFALNAKLGLPASTSRADLMNAMNGKVIGKAIYIGIFEQK